MAQGSLEGSMCQAGEQAKGSLQSKSMPVRFFRAQPIWRPTHGAMTMAGSVRTALGARVDKARIKAGAPPIILRAQVDGFIPLQTPEELKQWQDDLKTFYGISMDASGLAGIAGECCCGGCSDMCDLLA
jgi:hypothetical protein